ncbi:hypothetical protein PUN28_001239 [Cardiocondyla obscurior]|uniref:Uncharacterized protein n=1 Tax=Cardiocondyla obscurior TaxID=286306 RepID=A0AAW2H418_9HYME
MSLEDVPARPPRNAAVKTKFDYWVTGFRGVRVKIRISNANAECQAQTSVCELYLLTYRTCIKNVFNDLFLTRGVIIEILLMFDSYYSIVGTFINSHVFFSTPRIRACKNETGLLVPRYSLFIRYIINFYKKQIFKRNTTKCKLKCNKKCTLTIEYYISRRALLPDVLATVNELK